MSSHVPSHAYLTLSIARKLRQFLRKSPGTDGISYTITKVDHIVDPKLGDVSGKNVISIPYSWTRWPFTSHELTDNPHFWPFASRMRGFDERPASFNGQSNFDRLHFKTMVKPTYCIVLLRLLRTRVRIQSEKIDSSFRQNTGWEKQTRLKMKTF